MNETKELSRWLAGLRYSDLPKQVVDFTKRFILDDIGCMIGGALQLGNKSVLRDVMSLGEKPECTTVYYGYKTSAPNAALVNGAFIAGWDYDSMAEAGGGHMGSQTAALLAMAEKELVNGRDLLVAECAGIEAQCRVGASAKVRYEGIGGGGAHPWHSNTTLGPFAAAVTTGKILCFDEKTMENAIAIVTSNMGGDYQHYFKWGSNMKRARCGIGAWSGVRAALLAAEGLTGPKESIEGEKGWMEAMAGREDDGKPWFDAAELTRDLGTKWSIFSYNTKGGGCGCVTTLQCPTLTAVALKNKYDPKLEEIESVVVEFKDAFGIYQSAQILGVELGDTPEQRLGSSGWSMQWMIAEALVIGMPGIREQLNNIKPYGRYKEIEELSKKVTGRVNKQYYLEHFGDRPHQQHGGRILVTMKDGKVLEHEPVIHPGCRLSGGSQDTKSMINTITVKQLEEKFKEQATVAGFSEEKQNEIIRFVNDIENRDNILPLIVNLVRGV